MKRLLCLCALMAFTAAPAGAVVTFDDLPDNDFIPYGYAGLNWDNFYVVNGTDYVATGYQNGIISPYNVALNAIGDPAEISGTPFDLGGLYLTAAWNTGLNVDIEGYLGSDLLYSQTVVVDLTSPTLVALNFLNVDRVRFVSYGGTDYSEEDGGAGTQFVLDNMSLEPVAATIPAPAALLLGSLGAGLVGWLRRRKSL